MPRFTPRRPGDAHQPYPRPRATPAQPGAAASPHTLAAPPQPFITRMDMHAHSRASSGPASAALGFIGCPECYSSPEQVFDQAMAREMDLATITDHDSIAGALELHERGFQRFVIGQEVTVYFPEDRCKLHVLVWGLSPDHHEQLGALGLRKDVYAFAHWLHEHNLAHSLAHPLYVQNGRLDTWHLERCTLLFKCFETLNGAHAGTHRSVLDPFLDSLTPTKFLKLIEKHGFEPLWPRTWEKGRTGGSDDHALLNVGRTWTEVRSEGGSGIPIADPREFLREVMHARCAPGGVAGHSSLLAHQLTTVAAHYCADRLPRPRSPVGQLIASKLLRFAGVSYTGPGKLKLAFHLAKRKLSRRTGKTTPVVTALKECFGPVLAQYPDLRARLDPACWTGGEGAAIGEHDRMAQFTDDLSAALTRAMSSGAIGALRRKDKAGIVDHLLSYAIVNAAQIPYLIGLFHQNKDRVFLDRVGHETGDAGSGVSVLERPMRLCLITDTLGDVNGVSRFIQNVAAQALATGRDLQVVTSTRLPLPPGANIVNFEPVFATKMPKYENLEVALPPLMKMLRHLDRAQPDALHISTPGPVGAVGYIAAKMLRIPVLGVYHTDFPAYVDHLFDDHAFTKLTETAMRLFYAPFSAVFTRSQDYVDSLANLGIARDRIVRLMPGLDIETFHPRYKDPELWSRLGAEANPGGSRPPGSGPKPGSVKVLYCGRVSIEKNLPFLTAVWKRIHAACRARGGGLSAELIVVGDGPYRPQMQEELQGCGAHFLGFRHGRELSSIYAGCDLFAFPSLTDTLGQVVMESQASGMPVLVTDQGGPKEVVVEGVTGHILSAERADAWVEAIVGLIDDGERRRRMGAAAHQEMQQYSIRRSFEHFWGVHVCAWHAHLAKLGIKPKAAPDRALSASEGSVPVPASNAER